MPTAVSDAANAPVAVWDGGIWDFEEGVDFDEGEWPKLACEMKAIATMLGGYGSAAEIITRDKKGAVKARTFRWHYMARSTGWRGIL